jgi:molecular chaperone IbpA
MVMSTIDFSPLFRSTIGFDRVARMLENSRRLAAVDGWPPYDIARVGENDYRITVVAAGFAPDELTVTQELNALTISGAKKADAGGEYLYRGIVDRGFQRRFDLADHVQVVGARLEHGLLTIDLHRELPEALKPRQIEIGRGPALRQIEADRRAA